MRAHRVAAIGIAAAAGAAFMGAHRFGQAAANIRRYSMPNAGTYDLVTRLVFGRRYDEIALTIAAEAPDGGTVVDLGCGPGEVLLRVAALAPSLDLTGVDLDAEMIERAKRKADRRLAPADARRVRFVAADASALPLPDESVDLVVSSYAVHHLPDRHAARAEIMRVLKPGGRALIWDIVSPHGEPDPAAGHGSPPAGNSAPVGHQVPGQHGLSALAILRMWLRFGRIPADRYELRKPAI